MTFSQHELRSLGTIPTTNVVALANESATNFTERRRYVFVSHSNLDSELARGFVNKARQLGVNVYFDLYDSTLRLPPSADTAKKLRVRIQKASHFILLATVNSVQKSKWCPWELGCADGNNIPISIAQTMDDSGNTWGAEYLSIYHSVEIMNAQGFGLRMARMKPRGASGSTLSFDNWFNSYTV